MWSHLPENCSLRISVRFVYNATCVSDFFSFSFFIPVQYALNEIVTIPGMILSSMKCNNRVPAAHAGR